MVDIRTLVAEYPEGISFDALLQVARLRVRRTLTPNQLRQELLALGESIEFTGNRWRLRLIKESPSSGAGPGPAINQLRPKRVVAIDCESLVRQVPRAPEYKERHLYQVGAQRIGLDTSWIESAPSLEVWVTLAQEVEPLLLERAVGDRYQERARDLSDGLNTYAAFIRDADYVVAYNGTGLDFPLLDQAFASVELPRPQHPRHVDALYLAYALWPVPPNNHRLADLLKRLDPDSDIRLWHDAAADCRMLVALLEEGIKTVRSWPKELQGLVGAVGTRSEAWQMLFGLMSEPPSGVPLSEASVRLSVTAGLRGRPPLRAVPQGQDTDPDSSIGFAVPTTRHPTLPTFVLPETITCDGAPRYVDVHKLSVAAKGADAERRRAQAEMVETMRRWIAEARAALVEAPTGTGKSFAMIAIALEWLAASPRHRVVLSTFTKQLQHQLAQDLEKLDETIPGLLGLSDLVKGKGNRLSLRGLLVALTDMAGPAQGSTKGGSDFTSDARYADLALYLTLRLLAEGTTTENWLARSVDPNDIPGFFNDYIPRKCDLYLAHLSQGKAGEFPYRPTDTLSRYTSTVREALTQKRLVIANHALLFANLNDLRDLGPDTMVLIDEAHQLEAAATNALGAQFASPELERIAEDLADWATDQNARSEPEIVALQRTADELQDLVRCETLPNAAARAFDALKRDPLSHGYARRMVVASPLEGTGQQRDLEGLRRQFVAVCSSLTAAWRALWNVRVRPDPFSEDRRLALRDRLDELRGSLKIIVDGIRRIEQPGPDDLPPNDLVWAEEILTDRTRPASGTARFRFRVWRSPIELGAELRYQEFLRSFPRLYLISATLRVGGSFEFMRERLALPPTVGEAALDSPFDHARQARLLVMSDFPSWTEQQGAAERTVAQHVAGFASEIGADDHKGGVIVLTTSKRSAAGIGEALAEQRARHAATWPLIAADVVGTVRSVEEFNTRGGVLVGTKGLWQGVDASKLLNLVWINKLPFASFEDPLIKTRKALVASRAMNDEGIEDPDAVANTRYYLPLAAIELRQAVGRLLRSAEHRGVVIVSDRKLSGPTKLRRLYREVFLGSLDPGLLRPKDGERAGGNLMPMADAWQETWRFLGGAGLVPPDRVQALTEPHALERFTQLPETLEIRKLRMTDDDVRAVFNAGGPEALADEVERRAERVAQLLKRDEKLTLRRADRPQQADAIRAVAKGEDVLGLLPTGYGKSFVFQLPALVLPGVTIVVSPLVSLMTDQALDLNRAIGGAVRALVAPMRESNSRTGKQEVAEQLTGRRDHGIRMVYLSPERLSQRHFQDWLCEGTRKGIVRRIALDEAHCFATWGEDFRPSFKRAEQLLAKLKALNPDLQIIALTATATPTVRAGLRRGIFRIATDEPNERLREIRASPIRENLALYRTGLAQGEGGPVTKAGIVEEVVSTFQEHAILYTLTVKEAIALYNHIQTFLGEGEKDRVYLFHGRLSDHDKANVSNAFKDAPTREDDPETFRPLIVVATSAFGLGIDRPDVRAVFCVSPPTDLAALYQQVGRAGRDGRSAFGLMLATPRGFATIDFMTRSTLRRQLIDRIAERVLSSPPPLDMAGLAEEFVNEDLRTNLIEPREAKHVAGQYQVYVARVFAELDAIDAIEDLGDFPDRVKIVKGEAQGLERDVQDFLDALWTNSDTSPVQDLVRLWQRTDWTAHNVLDIGELWTEILALHAGGYIDVSQQVTRRYLSGYKVKNGRVSPAFSARFERRHQDLLAEVAWLKAFFRDHHHRCINHSLAEYFEIAVTGGQCATPEVRCSSCWGRLDSEGQPPPLYQAFMKPPQRRGAADERRRREQRRLERDILSVLSTQRELGLPAKYLKATLKGEDRVRGRDPSGEITWTPLWPPLPYHRAFGAFPGTNQDVVDAALVRLASRGDVRHENGRWILARFAAALSSPPGHVAVLVPSQSRRRP
ncbi:MAG: DEAD/DEAH box helicase [Chloroflexota bacterium]|nr:DEAD/DEAH box helicase [Chloroflexota bacterium]